MGDADGHSRVSSENVAAVRRYVDAFNCLDLDAATVGLDPAIELREWPEAPGAQTYHGVDGVPPGIRHVVRDRSYNVYTFRDGLVTLVELFTDRDSALAAFDS